MGAQGDEGRLAACSDVQQGVALGHLAILKATHSVLTEAIVQRAVPQAFGESLLEEVKHLGRAHQLLIGSLRHADRTAPGSEAAMLLIGTVVRDLTRGHAGEESPRMRLDALLRSGFGQADLVARIVTPTRATFLPSGVSPLQAARPLQLAALEHIADPALLSPEPWTRPDVPVTTAPSESPEVVEVVPMARPAGVETRVAPGERLGTEAVIELCRIRDLGVAAQEADPADPPAALRDIDPATWPDLVEAGRQAVADLVVTALPMVGNKVRANRRRDDQGSELSIALLQAAYRFRPQPDLKEGG